eukprot:GEMP01055172.1.p2 GENE.GEMP01055172.1~~GEMP01055172.1.p2  ORF type:complete len:126 (-),score=14.02 GEMP01055172.1:337-714(-)
MLPPTIPFLQAPRRTPHISFFVSRHAEHCRLLRCRAWLLSIIQHRFVAALLLAACTQPIKHAAIRQTVVGTRDIFLPLPSASRISYTLIIRDIAPSLCPAWRYGFVLSFFVDLTNRDNCTEFMPT